jgi:hypothetical protein
MGFREQLLEWLQALPAPLKARHMVMPANLKIQYVRD